MTTDEFCSTARLFRNQLEYTLKRSENVYTRDEIRLKVEMINILIQQLGKPAYIGKHKIF